MPRNNVKYDNAEVFCQHCGKSLGVGYKVQRRKYCSNQCQADHRTVNLERDWESLLEKWSLGLVPEAFVYTAQNALAGELRDVLKARIKDYLLVEQSHKCAICGQEDTWNGKPLTLILDHISGDPYDHSKDNLRLVCPNCDMQSPTWGSRNRGNGRLSGRQTYSRVQKMKTA